MTRSRRVRLALVSTFAAACVVGIKWAPPLRDALDQSGLGSLPPGVSRADLNLLVVTLDTTRADHLGAYGFQSISTPNIDWLARDGILFLQTSAAAPLTMPAHASLYTGRFPFGHGVRDNADFALDPGQTTLAEVLQQQGYDTGAFVSSVVLASSRGLNQGFDSYRDDFVSVPGALRRRADEVTDDALSWLARAGSSRFFAWLHFYDAHAPYQPRSPYLESYVARPYDAEIAFMDEQVGRVLDFLRQGDLLDRTIVVVIADHGEGLGDHREAGHGIFVYDSVIRVPFIIRTPFSGLRARIVDDVTRSVDVMPTLLDLIDVPGPDAIDGRSLIPLMTGKVPTLNLDAYSESMYPLRRFGWSDLRALRTGRFKVIAAPRPELYDLDRDPFEEHNVFDTERALGERMIDRLREMEAAASSSGPSRARAEIEADTAAKLASLGYVSRPGVSSPTDLSELPDPKDQIGTLNPGGLP
jgi:arylsulfatase A-like enzyme